VHSDAATSTAALACSGFKALSEFGFILTVGMFMTGLHTLLTVPALMQLWGRYIKAACSQGHHLPFSAGRGAVTVDFAGRHGPRRCDRRRRPVSRLAVPPAFPSLGGNFVVESGADSPGLTAQNLLSSKYGIEGSPDVLLIAGSEEEVLSRAENLTLRTRGNTKERAW